MLFDAIIVGAGPAGTFAAQGLSGKNVLVLDVGKQPPPGLPEVKNFYDLRKSGSDLNSILIGNKFESIHNVFGNYINPKVKSPLCRYIIEGASDWTPTEGENFDPFLSLAAGGMANGWGAGCFRFLDRELEPFPFSYRELKPYYDEVTKVVGINGEEDDLTATLGETTYLQKAQPLPRIAKTILARYQKNHGYFEKHNLKIGRLRHAVLTEPLDGRPASSFDNLEFFRPHIQSIYNPWFTMKSLIDRKAIRYEAGHVVQSFEESADGVTVRGITTETRAPFEFKAKSVVLTAGTLNTTRIVLESKSDLGTTLPLVENPISYVPFIDFTQIGMPVEKKASPAFFGILFDQPDFKDVVWCSMYGLWGPLRSEYLFDFPLSARGSIKAAKWLTSGMSIVQCFYPGTHPPHQVSLKANGVLNIKAGFTSSETAYERMLIQKFRRIGLFSHPALIKRPAAGNSFHYACTLPMRDKPGPYQTDSEGRLFGYKNVFIADAANFSSLPAINHTMTIMANALRIAERLRVAI